AREDLRSPGRRRLTGRRGGRPGRARRVGAGPELLQVRHAAGLAGAVADPVLAQPDPAVGEGLRRAAAAAGDDRAVVQHEAVGELDAAVRTDQPGDRAAPEVAAGRLAPEQVAVLVVRRDRAAAVRARLAG